MNESNSLHQVQQLVDLLGWDEEGRPTVVLLRAFHADLLREDQHARLLDYVERTGDFTPLASGPEEEIPTDWLERAREIEAEVLAERSAATMASAERMITLAFDFATSRHTEAGERVVPENAQISITELWTRFEAARADVPAVSDEDWSVLRNCLLHLLDAPSLESRQAALDEWRSTWERLRLRLRSLNERRLIDLWNQVYRGLSSGEGA